MFFPSCFTVSKQQSDAIHFYFIFKNISNARQGVFLFTRGVLLNARD